MTDKNVYPTGARAKMASAHGVGVLHTISHERLFKRRLPVLVGQTFLSVSGRCTHRPEPAHFIGRCVQRPMTDKNVCPTGAHATSVPPALASNRRLWS